MTGPVLARLVLCCSLCPGDCWWLALLLTALIQQCSPRLLASWPSALAVLVFVPSAWPCGLQSAVCRSCEGAASSA